MRFQVLFENNKAVHTIITDCLQGHEIPYQVNPHGNIDVTDPVDGRKLAQLRDTLRRYHIDIISDGPDALTEEVKNVLLDEILSTTPSRKLSILLSERLGRRYSQIARTFQENTGFSIENYCVALRIELAKGFLAAGEDSCTEIAKKLRYGSLGHFSKQFKKHTGITLSFFKRIVELKLNPVHA